MQGDWAPGPGLRGVEPPPAVAGLRIGILGTYVINGRPAAPRPAHGELLLVLALAPDGLDNDRLRYCLGDDPDHPLTGDALRQQVTRARQRLGAAPDGREWVQHLGGGHYALHPAASLDWADFEDLSDGGLATGDRAVLRAALALVRGEPFTGCDLWWLDAAFTEAVRMQVTDTAATLAGMELDAGDPAASVRAACAGLRAVAASEPLWRAVMLAEHAAGNPAGVHGAYTACIEAIGDAGIPGQPHLDTIRLYHRLAPGAA